MFGAGVTSFLMGRERLAAAYVGAGALFAASVAAIGLGPDPIVVLACVVLSGVGWAFVYVEALTLAQRLAGDDVMSRVFGVMESTMMASQSLGALAVPLLIVVVGPMGAIAACGLAFGMVVAIAAPTLIRADRLSPERVRRLRAMRGVPMFGPLSATVLERLVTSSTTVEVEAGQAIVTVGEVGDRFYVILAGEVEVATPGGGAAPARGRWLIRGDRPPPRHPTDGDRDGGDADRATGTRPRGVPRGIDRAAAQPSPRRRRIGSPARCAMSPRRWAASARDDDLRGGGHCPCQGGANE